MISTYTILDIIGFHILLQLASASKRPLVGGDRAGNGGSSAETLGLSFESSNYQDLDLDAIFSRKILPHLPTSVT
jgi:hypothetical protein